MKYVTRSLSVCIGLFVIFNSQLSPAFAQGTAFTYQGRLNNNGSPANGNYNIQFTLYATNQTGFAIAGPLTNSPVSVSNGLFTTLIDFGPGVFTGNSYWLDIAVCTNGNSTFTELMPRQPVTPTPYAIMANSASNLLGALSTAQLTGTFPASNLSGTISSANFSGTYGNPVSFNNGADSFDGDFFGQFFGSLFQGGTFTGQFLGDGSGIININPAHIAGQVAFLNSNQTFTAQNIFMQPIGLGNFSPSPYEQIDALAAQSNVRMVSTNTFNGAVLELMNLSSYPGEYLGAINFNNTNNAYPGQIGYMAPNPSDEFYDYLEFRVGGSVGLTIQADPRGAEGASIVGGFPGNNISTNSGGDVIAGGGYPGIPNLIYSNSYGVFIGAGSGNQAGPTVNDSVIAGGYGNTLLSYDTVIDGGVYNLISTNAQYALIGGGTLNTNAGYSSTIGGGYQNLIGPGANFSSVSGGNANTIQSNSTESVIGGGIGNIIHNSASFSMIGMGFYSTINPTNFGDFIGGGQNNFIDSYNTVATIDGGLLNRIEGNIFWYTNGLYAIASTIAGGVQNVIDTNNQFDAIGGGWDNVIQSNVTESVIGGGVNNTVQGNAYQAFIGGGYHNQVGGAFPTVPGGYNNFATGQGSFAAGTQAQATNNGAFVLADNEFINFSSTANNQLSARFTGGIVLVTGGAGMTLDGQPIFSGSNGSGLTSVNAATLNGLNSTAFAPASGSANYIQNQSSPPQAASFNINGNASIGGTVAANALIVTNNVVVGGTVSANSLTITNQFRVAGASINTPTAAFIQLSASTNDSGNLTVIYNPACDNDPNALLIVTPNFTVGNNAGGPGYNNHPIGVYYNGAHWGIFNEDASNMVANTAFNVLVIKH